MILSEKYIWIKIPRTGTHSYKMFFDRYNDASDESRIARGVHAHYTYQDAIKKYKRILPGVTVVRHPVARFYSSLKFMLQQKKLCSDSEGECWFNKATPGKICDGHNFSTEFLTSTQQCIEFLSENFIKNCYLKRYPTRHNVSRPGINTVFKTNNPMFIQSFFSTQAEFAYHPKIQVFKYEKMHEFNTWIQQTLGYDITQIPHENSTDDVTLDIDINEPEFVKVVEMLFYDDYKVFNYPLKYLT